MTATGTAFGTLHKHIKFPSAVSSKAHLRTVFTFYMWKCCAFSIADSVICETEEQCKLIRPYFARFTHPRSTCAHRMNSKEKRLCPFVISKYTKQHIDSIRISVFVSHCLRGVWKKSDASEGKPSLASYWYFKCKKK